MLKHFAGKRIKICWQYILANLWEVRFLQGVNCSAFRRQRSASCKTCKTFGKACGFKKKTKQKNVSCDVTSFQNLLFTSHIGENQR